MLWLEAKVVDIGAGKRILSFEQDIGIFTTTYSDRRNLKTVLDFWNLERKIVLPFRLEPKRIDLSFLIGVANLTTLKIVCAMKSYSPQKSGYNILGFRQNDDGLVQVKRNAFSGFDSDNWQVMCLGNEGYTVFVYVQEAVSIWNFWIGMKGKKLMLIRDFIFQSDDKRLFEVRNELNLVSALRNRPGLAASDIAIFAKAIYDEYRDLQRFRKPELLAAKEGRNLAP